MNNKPYLRINQRGLAIIRHCLALRPTLLLADIRVRVAYDPASGVLLGEGGGS